MRPLAPPLYHIMFMKNVNLSAPLVHLAKQPCSLNVSNSKWMQPVEKVSERGGPSRLCGHVYLSLLEFYRLPRIPWSDGRGRGLHNKLCLARALFSSIPSGWYLCPVRTKCIKKLKKYNSNNTMKANTDHSRTENPWEAFNYTFNAAISIWIPIRRD